MKDIGSHVDSKATEFMYDWNVLFLSMQCVIRCYFKSKGFAGVNSSLTFSIFDLSLNVSTLRTGKV